MRVQCQKLPFIWGVFVYCQVWLYGGTRLKRFHMRTSGTHPLALCWWRFATLWVSFWGRAFLGCSLLDVFLRVQTKKKHHENGPEIRTLFNRLYLQVLSSGMKIVVTCTSPEPMGRAQNGFWRRAMELLVSGTGGSGRVQKCHARGVVWVGSASGLWLGHLWYRAQVPARFHRDLRSPKQARSSRCKETPQP